jgi:galactokinase
VVCLAPDDLVEDIRKAVAAQYPARSGGVEATFHVCRASPGARRIA